MSVNVSLLPVSCVRQKLLWRIREEFRPTSTTPGPGNSSNILRLFDTCGLRIALTHNGYQGADLHWKKRREQKQRKRRNCCSLKAGLEFLNTTPPPPPPLPPPASTFSQNKSAQKLFHVRQCCFITSVISRARLLDVATILISVYSICIVVLRLSGPSLAAIDLAKRGAAQRGAALPP